MMNMMRIIEMPTILLQYLNDKIFLNMNKDSDEKYEYDENYQEYDKAEHDENDFNRQNMKTPNIMRVMQ